MRDWKSTLVSPNMPILKAIEIIDLSTAGIALVVDELQHLLGTVTDGDVRRAILKGIDLSSPISCIMSTNPTVAKNNDSREDILATMRVTKLTQIPIVNESRQVVNLETVSELISSRKRENWVVLMAGGLGQRLHPLTNECPKPLLKVGNKPILETIIQNFIEQGFQRFFISVNFKADMIIDYFGDGSKWGVRIEYIREQQRLGTAGALSLLPEKPKQPTIVMNGDLLTKVNFNHLLQFHLEHNSCATMCVRQYKFQVPYGVVQMDKHRLTGIVEKPMQDFFVSAGVYVLDPSVLNSVPVNEYFDMPALFETLIAQRKDTAVFPVREYWLDIGRLGDYEKANGEFAEIFS